jgi:hypothetical protein
MPAGQQLTDVSEREGSEATVRLWKQRAKVTAGGVEKVDDGGRCG